MDYLLTIYVPIISAIIWATVKTHKRGSTLDTVIVGCIGLFLVTNGVMKHFEISGHAFGYAAMMLQQLLSCLIIPMAYMYFASMVNRPLRNGTTNALFAVVLLLLMPNIVVVVGNGTVEGVASGSFVVVGDTVHTYSIADVIIPLQTIIAMMRIVPLFYMLRRYGLEPSRDVKMFVAWWIAASAFAVVASFVFSDNANAVFHIVFMLVVTSAFWIIGRGIDINPVVRDTKPEVPGSKDMAQRLMELIETQHIHLQKGYTVDDAIRSLGTNKTYLYEMLHKEFGCTFSELMNRKRVAMVKEMLQNTDENISDIAEQCGFVGKSYMTKVFKQLEGCTPSKYKNCKR